MNNKKKSIIWLSSILGAIIIMILCIILLSNYREEKNTDKMLKVITEVAQIKSVQPVDSTLSEDDKDIYELASKFKVNFDNLKSINADTVGWIKVEGTNINYPYVQASDNNYYLKHSFDKTYNKKGWVFLDYRNNTSFLDSNTILYAHGLMNNQMFGSMRNIVKPSWYKNKRNQIVTTTTPDRIQVWQVFSTYTIEPESYYITVNFNSEDEYEKYINVISLRSVYDYNVSVTKDDKILTLSSCYDNKKRMVLHAKLISNIEY